MIKKWAKDCNLPIDDSIKRFSSSALSPHHTSVIPKTEAPDLAANLGRQSWVPQFAD